MKLIENLNAYQNRLVLYFPVSSLVTLFANVLQNPQDARARSDVRLMNQVVNFLSTIAITEEQGGVKRMLGVCREFERIANVVLEKSEKSGRQKRKTARASTAEPVPKLSPHQIPEVSAVSCSPGSEASTSSHRNIAPTMTNHQVDPSLPPFSTALSNPDDPLKFAVASPHGGHKMATNVNEPSSNPEGGGPIDGGKSPMPDMSQFPTDNPSSPLNMGAFQQPFVPQDLWNMPMTLEWDWADMNMEFNAGKRQDGAAQGEQKHDAEQSSNMKCTEQTQG